MTEYTPAELAATKLIEAAEKMGAQCLNQGALSAPTLAKLGALLGEQKPDAAG